jgi:hypothetical protein
MNKNKVTTIPEVSEIKFAYSDSSPGPKKGQRLSNAKIDTIAGAVAGMVSNFISHPLDTIKTRIQISSTHSVSLR